MGFRSSNSDATDEIMSSIGWFEVMTDVNDGIVCCSLSVALEEYLDTRYSGDATDCAVMEERMVGLDGESESHCDRGDVVHGCCCFSEVTVNKSMHWTGSERQAASCGLTQASERMTDRETLDESTTRNQVLCHNLVSI